MKKSKNNSIMKMSKGTEVNKKKSKGNSKMKMSKGNAVMKKSKGGSVVAGNANRRRADQS